MTLAFTVSSKNTTQDLLLSTLLIPAYLAKDRRDNVKQVTAVLCVRVCVFRFKNAG